MTYNDLKPHERRRFKENPRCLYCGEIIKNNDEFKFIKTRFSRYVIYLFIHRGCIFKARDWLKRKEGELYGKNEVRV